MERVRVHGLEVLDLLLIDWASTAKYQRTSHIHSKAVNMSLMEQNNPPSESNEV